MDYNNNNTNFNLLDCLIAGNSPKSDYDILTKHKIPGHCYCICKVLPCHTHYVCISPVCVFCLQTTTTSPYVSCQCNIATTAKMQQPTWPRNVQWNVILETLISLYSDINPLWSPVVFMSCK